MDNMSKLMKFDLGDNLKKYITEVDLGSDIINTDADGIQRHVEGSWYDISINLGNPLTLKSCRVKFVQTKDQKGVEVDTRDETFIKLFGYHCFIKAEYITAGNVIFKNKHYTHNDETNLFCALLSDDIYAENKCYRFNVDAFNKIPEIHGDRYIFVMRRSNWYKTLWKIEYNGITETEMRLSEPHTGQFHSYTPLQFLTGMELYPVDVFQHLKRTEDGLLIPPYSEIISISAFDPTE